MPFKIRYQVNIDFVGAGAGPMEVLSPAAGQMLPGGGGSGQTKGFVGNPAIIPVVIGAGAGQTLTGGDVTTLTNAMAADMATQINAALASINTWPTGGP
jgi:hypothetical protein